MNFILVVYTLKSKAPWHQDKSLTAGQKSIDCNCIDGIVSYLLRNVPLYKVGDIIRVATIDRFDYFANQKASTNF